MIKSGTESKDFSGVIKQCHLFSGVTVADLTLLVAILRKRECSKGKVLFKEGDAADGFYIVAQGKVKVYKLSADGRERILHIVPPGNSFAEAAIFDNGRYPAFAETLTSATLLFFPKTDFLNLLHRHPQLAINIISGLSRFLRQFTVQIEDLTFRDVPSRLARYLIDLAEESDMVVELPVSKSQLASNLGTTSETLSRTLRKLSDDEMITVKGKTITVLAVDRLADLAARDKES